MAAKNYSQPAYTCFKLMLNAYNIDHPTEEFKFHPTRRWRADYCWEKEKLILEVEGGVYTKGRHTSPTGFIKDMEKYNAAVMLGYKLVRVIPDDLCKTETMDMINYLLKG